MKVAHLILSLWSVPATSTNLYREPAMNNDAKRPLIIIATSIVLVIAVVITTPFLA